MQSQKTKTPRNFILLDSLNNVGKYTHVTYGLMDEVENDPALKNNYIKMEYWSASLIYDDGDNMNIFELAVRCTPLFPTERPILTFSEQSMTNKRIKKLCDSTGKLTESAKQLIKWNETQSLGDYLSAVLDIIAQ